MYRFKQVALVAAIALVAIVLAVVTDGRVSGIGFAVIRAVL